MLLRSDLARRTQMTLFNNYRSRGTRRPLRSRLRYQLGMLSAFRRELRRRPVNLVHVKTSSGINFLQNSLYALMARRSGLPVVLQMHGGMFEAFYQESASPVRSWIRHTLSSVDRVAVLSRGWADRIGRIAPRARFMVIPNGLEEDEVNCLGGGREERREQVLFLGTGDPDLNFKKGLQDLLEVLPRLLRRYPAFTWVLAGLHDPLQVRSQIKESLEPGTGLGERVRALPLVSGKERLALLKESSILVMPSHYENMPNLMLEAMAAEMGIVASDVGAIQEMLSPPDGGLLTRAGDCIGLMSALDQLLGTPSLVSQQGWRNRATVTRRYTLSIVERELENVYRECTEHAIRRPSDHRNLESRNAKGGPPQTPSSMSKTVAK